MSRPERLYSPFAACDTGAEPAVLAALRPGAMRALGVIFAVSVAAYALAGFHPALGVRVAATATAILLAIFGLVVLALPRHGHYRFGSANVVTAIRASMVSLAGAVVFLASELHASESVLWALAGLVAAALALDGLDGFLARRERRESAFGARFDMEVDAFLILVLSCATPILGKAGWWVVLIGTMRYGFVAAQVVFPRLRGDLPPSVRRKAICVVQVGALCILLAPVIQPPVSMVIAGVALALLSYSFAVDVRYLLSRRSAER